MNDSLGIWDDIGMRPYPEAWSPSSGLDRAKLPPSPLTAYVRTFYVSLSSSSTHPEKDWVLVFLQSTTTCVDLVEYPPFEAPYDAHVLPPTAEQLAAVQTCFGLSKTQLAQVCKVQRQTIYDWYAGNFQAEGDHARRLAVLFGIAGSLRNEGHRPLSARMASRVLSSGSTLLDLLSEDDIDGKEVAAIVAQLDQATVIVRSHGAAAVRERLGWPPIAEKSADETLDSNLDDFVDG